MSELALLFFAFAKIGCTLFGGGYAMLPPLSALFSNSAHDFPKNV